MESTHYILANLWLAIIAFFLLFYAITDGADLGLGMITLVTPDEKDRNILLGSIVSTWHTNQTWLVILGGMVFGAYPIFYGLVFFALYIPVMGMLFAMIIRGVALDYTEHSPNKRPWTIAFGLGSLLVAITQGFALGGLLGGIQVENGKFVGTMWDWFTPFTILTTVGVVYGYIMLGANFLILKAEGAIQRRGYRYSLVTSLVVGPLSAAVYVWMILMYPSMIDKFTTAPDAYWVIPGPVLAAVSYALLLYSLAKRYEILPMFLNAALILFSFAGVSAALYPHLIPNVIAQPVQITEAAASNSTLIFMTVVTAVILPLILVYNGYNQFWVFRGKIKRYYSEEEESRS